MKKNLLLIPLFFIAVFSSAQWTQINVPHMDTSYVFDLEVPNAQTVWAIPQYTAVQNNSHDFLRSADGGLSWRYDSITSIYQTHFDGYSFSDLAAIDADTCYGTLYKAGSTKGMIVKTTDGGYSWVPLDSGVVYNQTTSFPDEMYFWNAQEGITIGDPAGPGAKYFEIYRTTNAGNTWVRVPKANLPNWQVNETGQYHTSVAVGNHIWFTSAGAPVHGTPGARIYHSADRGLHWQASDLVDSLTIIGATLVPGGLSDIAFVDSLHGFIPSYGNYLFYTYDGGATWKHFLKDSVSGTFFQSFVAAVPGTTTVFTSSYGWGNQIGSSYSNDFGLTWHLVDTGNIYGHGIMRFLNDSLGWGGEYKNNASSFGGIYKWAPVTTAVNNIANPEISVSVFPNPSAGTVYIKVTKANNQNIQLNITDATGKIILADSYAETDNFFLHTVNISSFATGLYFVNVAVGNNRYTQKLLRTN